MKKRSQIVAAYFLLCCVAQAGAANPKLKCNLDFESSGWSVIYESAEGFGTVRCDDGEVTRVRVELKGLGISAGKWKIQKGTGKFFELEKKSDVYGAYYGVRGQIGLYKSGEAGALTRGRTSLIVSGKGDGWDAGVSVAQLRISEVGPDFNAPPKS